MRIDFLAPDGVTLRGEAVGEKAGHVPGRGADTTERNVAEWQTKKNVL